MAESEPEATPAEIARYLASTLHDVLVRIDTLPLRQFFDAVGRGDQFALVIQHIDSDVTAALSVATSHVIFDGFGDQMASHVERS